MAPAVHLFMPFKRRIRISAIIAALTLGGMLGWTYILADLDLPKEVNLAIIGSLMFVFVGREAVPLLNPGLGRRYGLTIDSAGLALTRASGTAGWRWDEVSDVRLGSRFHPSRVLYGRFISFRAPADGRRNVANSWTERLFTLGCTVVIADDYPSPVDEIFRQIEHYRTGAAGGETATRQPEPIWSFRKDRKQPKFLRLLLVVLGPFLGMVVAMALIGHLPESFGAFIESPLVFGFGIGIGAVMPWVILIQYRWESRQDNMLAVSAGGIVTKHKIERRLWLWGDILEMRMQQSVSRSEGGAIAQSLSFLATHDGTEPGKTPKAGKSLVPVSCAIEDFYETPIENIARQARVWWDWSRDTFGGADTAVAGVAAGEGKIAFRRRAGYVKGRGSPLDLILSFAFVTPILAWLGVLVWMIRADIRPPEWLDVPDWLDGMHNFLIMMVPLIGYGALLAPALNRLEVDEAGLLSVCYARKRRWTWQEVGGAQVRRVRSKWSSKQRAVLTVEAPRNGIGSAFLRWAFNIDNRRLAVIEDIYDASLDEIAEALNARRSRHGGRAYPQAAG